MKTGAMEEVDSDDNGELISNSTSLHEENSELLCSTSTTVAIKNAPSKNHKEEQDVEKQVSKRHQREQQHKIYCDQDVYADNYSMWIPPSDQAGDGKTCLNEKYGY